MSQITRGENANFFGNFKASATFTTSDRYKNVYISAENTVGLVTTTTDVPVGYIEEPSQGGSQSSVLVRMFAPSFKGLAQGAIAAGAQVQMVTATTSAAWLSTPTNSAGDAIAITAASVTGEVFEYVFIPLNAAPTVT